ncbi:EamA family transporter [Pokkaliibacter plantistimulans]|uniref:EamA family transporter n=1 Tax=Proteobacteria bacterium 228 TaxID=2083153 RepID=A0A2S5KS38_9PROT|nr:DMT family transporter [Pokkaliibacter plantistimulans]PPC77076.1 EamA family transporter [Pokkaliibacter plantistimulans]
MRTSTLRADILLLITAAIWGTAFVAQRVGMEHLQPFTFNFARFLLGGLSLLPLVYWFSRKRAKTEQEPVNLRFLLLGGIAAGLILFAGSSLQQVGLLYTTAGKAGFITGLYLIFVPILGLFLSHKTGANTWLGATLALVGLYFLSVTEDFTLAYGDALELIGAVFWAGHVLIIGWLSRRTDPLALSVVQLFTCMLLSLSTALVTEDIQLSAIKEAWFPIVYAGLFSVGVAYTLQIIGQKEAPPAHAAIILSGEAVFAVLGGWLLLDETLGMRELAGCALMLAGMLLSQFTFRWLRRRQQGAAA